MTTIDSQKLGKEVPNTGELAPQPPKDDGTEPRSFQVGLHF